MNKTSTRVTLLFDLQGSPSLTPDQKRRLGERLASRVGKDGILRVTARKHRSQRANRLEALQRFRDLVAGALHEAPSREKTRLPKAAKERRLEGKKRRGLNKRRRSERFDAGDLSDR